MKDSLRPQRITSRYLTANMKETIEAYAIAEAPDAESYAIVTASDDGVHQVGGRRARADLRGFFHDRSSEKRE